MLLRQELRQELTDDASENFLVGVEKVWKSETCETRKSLKVVESEMEN